MRYVVLIKTKLTRIYPSIPFWKKYEMWEEGPASNGNKQN